MTQSTAISIEEIRRKALRAISPLSQPRLDAAAYNRLFMTGRRTDAGRGLPPYYLVYFLLVDLLGFKNNGQWEKVAWSVTVEYKGVPFLIDHRKFGLGIFGVGDDGCEEAAGSIAACIHRAVKAAQPYFEYRAQIAAAESQLNVLNRSVELFECLRFHIDNYERLAEEAEARRDEVIRTQINERAWSAHRPAFKLRQQAGYCATAAIEGFFSWTEHVFIHIAILQGAISTGREVSDIAKSDWSVKYKTALDVADAVNKRFFDELLDLRRQLRNFVAHGSFGKDGEALQFHSRAGAVPVLLPHKEGKSKFRFGYGKQLQPGPAIQLINEFTQHIWSGSRASAKIYIQDYAFPSILTFVADRTYERAMGSVEEMEDFAQYLAQMMDNSVNMDF